MIRTMGQGGRFLVLVSAILAFLLGPRLVQFYVDWLWFGSVDLAQVFATSFKAQAFWTLAGGLLGFLLVYVSHLAVVRATRGRGLAIDLPPGWLFHFRQANPLRKPRP